MGVNQASAWEAYSTEVDLLCATGPTAATALLALGLLIHDKYPEGTLTTGVSLTWQTEHKPPAEYYLAEVGVYQA